MACRTSSSHYDDLTREGLVALPSVSHLGHRLSLSFGPAHLAVRHLERDWDSAFLNCPRCTILFLSIVSMVHFVRIGYHFDVSVTVFGDDRLWFHDSGVSNLLFSGMCPL
jgi:hypothetical protein